MNKEANYIPEKISLFKKTMYGIFKLFRLRNAPSIRLYKGYANDQSCYLYGHALSLSPIRKKHFRKFFLFNAIALLRLFMVRPIKKATVILMWKEETFVATTAADGFFKFEWQHGEEKPSGKMEVEVMLLKNAGSKKVKATAKGEIIVPSSSSFAFISDIDDTFLISHSSNLRKRLFVLLTENAKSRKPFDGAVKHYRLLHGIDDNNVTDNAFFYVSSSEWNLYDYINDFVKEYKLPQGVFLLNQIKTFSRLFSTGQNNHSGKFTRIVKILEAFPHQKFVLLGDDSQKDIDIYTSVVEHFPQSIHCVYIRRVGTPEKPNVLAKQKVIEERGVLFFYFAHSEDAILHSQKIGLIA